MTDEMTTRDPAEANSLDLVQRTVVSVLVGGITLMVTGVLTIYLATTATRDLPRDSVVGLWVMSGVIGLVGSCAILLLNRRRWYHPLLLLGIVPMLVGWHWVIA
ncbi:hypothetical protein [Propionicimonas sp.]|uniref:hypothetical protein n=1 Tax=Propionicimonas sp. TaxID=1955623 RepID=UPI0039E4BD62